MVTRGISIWDVGYRYRIWYIDRVIYHIVMVILDIDMGYGLMIWEMTISIWSSWRSIWDNLSLCLAQQSGVQLVVVGGVEAVPRGMAHLVVGA